MDSLSTVVLVLKSTGGVRVSITRFPPARDPGPLVLPGEPAEPDDDDPLFEQADIASAAAIPATASRRCRVRNIPGLLENVFTRFTSYSPGEASVKSFRLGTLPLRT